MVLVLPPSGSISRPQAPVGLCYHANRVSQCPRLHTLVTMGTGRRQVVSGGTSAAGKEVEHIFCLFKISQKCTIIWRDFPNSFIGRSSGLLILFCRVGSFGKSVEKGIHL